MFAAMVVALAVPSPEAVAAPVLVFIEPQDVSYLWLNAGFETVHFDRHAGLNGNNLGVGAEYQFSTVSSLTAGIFNNSNRLRSRYAGMYYQPIEFYGAHLGVVAGAFDGYPKMRAGGWFPAILPMVTFEGDQFGLNVAIVPSYKNRLYGGISFQVKLRAF